jgi:tRNA-splicing ligase RtcB
MAGPALSAAGPFEWEIPVSARSDMRVPGRVFASPSLLAKASEDKALEQVMNVATLPGIVRASYAMPDVHWGYGFPVGGVAATDVAADGVISPGGVGFDVCCGVRLLRTDIPFSEASSLLPSLVSELARRIPRGTGRDGLLSLSEKEMVDVLTRGVDAMLDRGLGWPSDASNCEDGGRLDEADASAVSSRALLRGSTQLGSLGAGNHFLEVEVVDEIFDADAARAYELSAGTLTVLMHTGSRGLGHQVCTDEVHEFMTFMASVGITVPDRQLACGPVSSPVGRRYLAAMAAAANFARANRHVLGHETRACFETVFGRPASDLGMRLVYDVAHNLAKLEEYFVDGSLRTLCVHRKGATRAFGPGHEELPLAYRSVGQPVLVPGSMGTESWVLAGMSEGRDKSFWSTCHGAGRMMSRTQAKKQMSGRDLARSLAEAGVLVNATQWGLLAEEAPYAYKDVSAVVEVCEGAKLSRKVARLRPLAVVKG